MIKLSNLILVLIVLCISAIQSYGQTTVNSLAELRPYLKESNADVKLAPGTYNITAKDAANGQFPDETLILNRTASVLLLFEGSNSRYDFTGVTIKVETAVFRAYGSNQVYEIQIVGNDNVLENLTLIDDGSVHDGPNRGALNIVIDGARNRVEGFHVTAKGSFPYGYGDAFGKGGGPVIAHQKHSACLIRGESNHVKNCTFIHRTYGHCIFMQAASNPKIEGCYVEGELRTTDDMLAEAGTGSPADKVNFESVWGYKVPRGYMMSTGEGGIRAYNAGETVIDGVEYDRGTSNPTILNCTIVRMRAGVTLTHATGTKYVEGCTTIECERGYAIGSGQIVNCKSDAKYGPAFAVDYQSDRGVTADITLLNSDNSYNGSKHIASIIGSNHNITFRSEDVTADQALLIEVGGDNRTIGKIAEDDNYSANNITINNLTNYPLILEPESSNVSGKSCGPVTNGGSNNSIQSAECALPDLYFEAEDYVDMNGVNKEPANDLSGVDMVKLDEEEDWMEYVIDIPSPGIYSFEIRVSSTAGGQLEFLVDGAAHSTSNIAATGGRYNWTTKSINLLLYAGEQTLRLKNTSGGFNLNWFELKITESDHTFVGWVSMEPQFVDLFEGEFVQLTPELHPANATNKEVSYESENPSIATVDQNGTVTAVSHGTTYIKVTASDGGQIDRSEITVNRPDGSNLALQGVATQSSTAYNGPPELAIDGNTDGNYGNGSVTHTNHDDPIKWWKVDLGENKIIEEIIIFNRTGGSYSERLNDFTVEIIDSENAVVFSKFISNPPNPSVTIDAGVVEGRTVKISKISELGLSLAEVEVHGYEKKKDEQIITFDTLPEKQVGDVDFSPGATASSGLEVVYVSSNTSVATIVEGNIQIVGSGVSTISAVQDGDDDYLEATTVSKVLTVTDPQKSDQTLTFEDLPVKQFGDDDFVPTASTSSGLEVTYTSSNTDVATVVNGHIHIVGVGTSVITAIQAGDEIYNPVTLSQALTIDKAKQTISFATLPSKKYGDDDFSPGASASSGLPVTYSSSNTNVAAIVEGKIQIVGVGTSSITAFQIGNDTNEATQETQVLTVEKADQAITFDALPEKILGDDDFWPGAISSSGLVVSYTSSDNTVATIVNGNISIAGGGVSTITASQTGDASFSAASSVSQKFTVTEVVLGGGDEIYKTQVYPNPVGDLLKVEFEIDTFRELFIYDINGKTIEGAVVERGSRYLTIGFWEVPVGIYILKLYGDDVVKTIRLMKN